MGSYTEREVQAVGLLVSPPFGQQAAKQASVIR